MWAGGDRVVRIDMEVVSRGNESDDVMCYGVVVVP